jgi:hypothetical protein
MQKIYAKVHLQTAGKQYSKVNSKYWEGRMETKKPEMVVCPKAKECGDECFYPIHKTPHEFMLGSCATITIGHACPACIPVSQSPQQEK